MIYHVYTRRLNMPKKPTNIRLSEDAKKLLTLLAQKLGLSQTGVIELAIREFAKKEKISL